jgi:branched-chain amino acid transport system permease protein
MRSTIRAGLASGIFAMLWVIISGGQIGLFAGLVAGLIAGLSASQSDAHSNMARAVRQGALTGLTVGVLIFIGQLIRTQLIDPIISVGDAPLNALVLGAGALVVAVITCAVVCAIRSLPHPNDRNGTYILIGVLVVLYPLLDQALSLNLKTEIIPVLVFLLMALGLNIVVGYAGLLDLGYAAFFAIGAYTTGFIASPHLGLSISFWIAIWIAAASAALFGVILGAPTLPLRGDYLAIVTLGFGEIVPIAMNNLDRITINILGYTIVENFDLTGGPRGINPINKPSLPFLGEFRPDNPTPWYYLIVVIMVISIFFILRLRNSRIGRSWTALREDELAAASMGINTVNSKLLAFAMGATFSGFAGAFYGSYISAIFPSSFDFSVSVMLLCMVILGGLGNMTGVILGGLIIQFADRLFLPQGSRLIQDLAQASDLAALQGINFASDFRLILFGLTLVIMMLVRPEGLVPNERRRAEFHEHDQVKPEPASA